MGGHGSGRKAANPDCRGSHTRQFRELTDDEKELLGGLGSTVLNVVVCEVCGRFVKGRSMGGYGGDWKINRHKPLPKVEIHPPKRTVTEAMVTEAGD